MRPEFIRAVPDEIERHGGTAAAVAAAVVLALIRWRCQASGPDRITDETGCWWRVSQADLAAQAGLSVDTARTALKKLERDGAVLAKHFPPTENQTRAYRVAHQDKPLTCQSVDSPPADLPVGRKPTPPRAVAHTPSVDHPTALPIETLETKRPRGDARRHQAPVTVPPAGKRPPAKCPEHTTAAHWCRRCQARAAWDADIAKARGVAVANVRAQDISRCDQCDDNGFRHKDAGAARCRLHRNLDDLDGALVVAS